MSIIRSWLFIVNHATHPFIHFSGTFLLYLLHIATLHIFRGMKDRLFQLSPMFFNQPIKPIMRTLFSIPIRTITGFAFLLLLCTSCVSQRKSGSDTASKKGSTTKEGEHLVPKGSNLHELATGSAIAAFSIGGEKKQALESFLTEQKVAGFLVLQDNKIRLERYSMGHSDTALWSSLSIAKSVTSTLVGAAIRDGYIKSVDDYATQYLPGLKGSAYDKVTVRHLITMTTGIRWSENYTDPDGDIAKFSTDPIDPGIPSAVSYMRRLPSVAEPGKKFAYSTGETHLLGTLVSAATGQTLAQYLSSKIWEPYGMQQDATWRLDSTGQELAGCCLQMPLRDFGRFGQFVFEGGRINGESIVPEDWFKTATSVQVPIWPGGGYGYGWWIFDAGGFDALGIYGQRIHIDPSRNLVVVLNSAWPEADDNTRQFAVSNFIKTIKRELDKEKKNVP